MSGEPEGGTGAWFDTRTDQQLRHILKTNSASTPACRIAWEELQRRAAKKSEVRQLRWIKATFWTTLILGAAAIAATLIKP